MNVEEIPADELVTMTAFWHKAFNAAGCDPTCHCCQKQLTNGMLFKLATVRLSKYFHGDGLELAMNILAGKEKLTVKLVKEYFDYDIRENFKKQDTADLNALVRKFEPVTKEVMLCDTCTPDVFLKKEIAAMNDRLIEYRKPKGGCFRVNGKIIH